MDQDCQPEVLRLQEKGGADEGRSRAEQGQGGAVGIADAGPLDARPEDGLVGPFYVGDPNDPNSPFEWINPLSGGNTTALGPGREYKPPPLPLPAQA